MKLTQKQTKFCDEYLIDLNATQAYIRAGYKVANAEYSASRLLSNDKVSLYIKEKQDEIAHRNDITVDFVVNGIKDIALLGEQENNRLKAYDLLGKHLGIYEKDNAQSKTEIPTTIQVTFIDESPSNKKDWATI